MTNGRIIIIIILLDPTQVHTHTHIFAPFGSCVSPSGRFCRKLRRSEPDRTQTSQRPTPTQLSGCRSVKEKTGSSQVSPPRTPRGLLMSCRPTGEWGRGGECVWHLFGFAERKQCASCQTRQTPLWRQTGDGTTLCNACGIRYKKYQTHCDSCWYVPRRESEAILWCPHCWEPLHLPMAPMKSGNNRNSRMS
uniref:GATA-type domain-containing protein n=1 Tax=Callorhinchus milii TaxID=7868 RepID=A0A4W3JN82_CALMI